MNLHIFNIKIINENLLYKINQFYIIFIIKIF